MNNLKSLAASIELLAKEIQKKVDNNESLLVTGNELVRNTMTFVFAMGADHNSLGQTLANPSKKGSIRMPKMPQSSGNKWSKRDRFGRFASK